MKPKLTRSFAPRTRPVAGAWRALIISPSRASALAEIKEPPADKAAAPAVARAMNSRRVDFFAMRIVLPIVYFRRSIAAQEKFAQKSERVSDGQYARFDQGVTFFSIGRRRAIGSAQAWVPPGKFSQCKARKSPG